MSTAVFSLSAQAETNHTLVNSLDAAVYNTYYAGNGASSRATSALFTAGVEKLNKKSYLHSRVQETIRGMVKDQDGNPLTGVTIQVKSTGVSAASNENGIFEIAAQQGDVLIARNVGFDRKEVTVMDQDFIDIVLDASISDLDEVVVVAYGTAKKSTNTGSMAVIDEEAFNNRPITEVSQALTGATPGLQVSTSNGQPGSEPTMRIRGIGSFNAGNAPLIVLDGMPYDNSLSSINPQDIESVTVLKDASSAALYGARGANGVLLINTKKGKSGQLKINAKYNLGLTSRQSTDYRFLNDKDYMEMYWEAHRNGFLLDGDSMEEAGEKAGSSLLAGLAYNPYLMSADELFSSDGKLNPNARNHWEDDTDWYGGITQTGQRHDANVSLHGGSQKTTYYSSIGYLDEQGFIKGSGFERFSGNGNVNSQISDWLKMGANVRTSYSKARGKQNETSGSISNPFRATRNIGNIFPIHIHDPNTGEYIYDENGEKIPDFGNGWTSPDGDIVIAGRDGYANSNHPYEVDFNFRGHLRQTINMKAYTDISFTEDLKLTLNGGLGSNMYRSWSGGYVFPQKGNAGSSTKNTSNTNTWTFQQLLNYDKTWDKHTVSALLGHESYKYEYHYMSTSMKTQSIPGDNFEYANFTEINALPNSYTHNYRVEGYLSRVNYDYDDRYFASASYRRDGSSRFYKDVRWGNFWSIGAGWALDREPFLENSELVNGLKLRASYGVVGNDDLSSYYPWRATYTPNDNGEPGYVQASLGNKALTWETSKNFDVAAEFTLFNRRLEGTVEYFHRESSDLLFSVPKPISAGVENEDVNAGSMYNRGIEVTLDGQVFQAGDFKMGMGFNTTYLKNKITDLPLDPYPTSVYKIEEGHSRYDFWLRQWHSVNPDNGYNLFVADTEQYEFQPDELIEKDGLMLTEDVEKSLYDYSGTAMPKFAGGFSTNFDYKNFSLKLQFYYQLGGKFYDTAYRSLMNGSLTYLKQHEDLLNRWRQPGDITDVSRVSMGADRVNIEAASATRWLTSSNMLELTNINLGYKVPARFLTKAKISDAMIYFSADNVMLLTKKKGMYPRRNYYAGYIGNSDVYPPSSVVSMGISLTF